MAPSPMSSADDTAPTAFYNRDLIDLAAQAGDACDLRDATHRASARSPICGSLVDVALTLDDRGRITGFGYRLEACALTKSVVAVMKDAMIGASRDDIVAAHDALVHVLAGDGAAAMALWPGDAWQRMMILAPLKDYPVRHTAMQLPLVAAEKAFDNKVI